MHRIVSVIAVLVFIASIAVAGSPPAIEIVLDASASMNRAGPGGSPIEARVRESIAAVVAEAAAPGSDVRIGLRVAGGGERTESLGTCSATDLVLAVADLEPERWLRRLDAVRPWGLRPLFASVAAAVADLEPVTGQRRIVIVTSGDDQCGLGPQQVAAALAAQDRSIDLRMVGLGVGPDVADRFGSVPFRNAATADELLTALRWAILDTDVAARPTGTLVLSLMNDTADPVVARVDLVDLATGSVTTDTVTGEGRFDLSAGRHHLVIAPQSGGRTEFRNLLILAGTERRVELDPAARHPVAVDVGTDPVVAGAPTWIDVAGAVPDDARLLFVDANGLVVSPVTNPSEIDGWSVSPALAGPLELLLIGPEEDGLRRVLANRSTTAVRAEPDLTAPDEVGIGEELTVSVSGPQCRGGFVGLVPRGGAPTEVVWCAEIGMAEETRFNAPPNEAELDLICVDGATMSVTARQPLRVTAPKASVSAPALTAPGEAIEVVWTGPEADEDFLSLAPTGSSDDAYIEWARAEDGSPAALRAPDTPGVYEVRYVDGRTGQARARARIEVEAVPVELVAPATAKGGRRFEVAWTGPDAAGDFLAISKPGSAPHHSLDWAPTTVGSPLTLAAPSRPGTYEVRYVTGSGREILAAVPIEVRR